MNFSAIRRLFSVETGDVELSRAQFDAFLKQIPLLYFILIVNSCGIAYTYRGVAPPFLSIYIPGALCAFAALRFLWWIHPARRHIPDAEAVRQLVRTNRLTALLSVFFAGWSISLFAYGDDGARAHLIFFMAMTMIGCVFCLMHMRSAALLVATLADLPFVLFFFAQGGAFRVSAINLALVSGAMILVLFTYYRDFANLVASRRTLMQKQVETQRLSDENFRIANLDSLTDLPNRRSFFAALDQKVADHPQARGVKLAVAVVDLDGFKPINDTYGHLTGDAVLYEVSRRLADACKGAAQVHRLGGDEFGVLVEGEASSAQLLAIGDRITSALSAPYYVGDVQLSLGCSIGFAVYPDMAETPSMLYERADYALYYAKRHQRGETVLFSKRHEDEIRKCGVIELALKNARFDEEMSVAFQPIVDADSGVVMSFEALARWHSPTLGHVSPGQFVPVAERSGHIRAITRTLLAKALGYAAKWPDHIRVSFNLSAYDISSSEAVMQIIAIVTRSGVKPTRIDFEITETAVTYDFVQASAAINALKALGCGISLDDFGTGFSSLSHVHRLPLDKIKVDRSFVSDISTNEVSHKIVKSLQALCSDMGIECVVEGVEREDQLATLATLGCNMIQGYYFSKPIAPEAVANFLVTHRPEEAPDETAARAVA